jgi:hypothetical protein
MDVNVIFLAGHALFDIAHDHRALMPTSSAMLEVNSGLSTAAELIATFSTSKLPKCFA